MTTHSSIPAWRIPWREEPGRLQFMGSQESGHDLGTKPASIISRQRMRNWLVQSRCRKRGRSVSALVNII